MPKITVTTILQRATNVLKANVDDEMVLMSIDEGKYYGANRIAKELWTLLENPISYADLCQKVAAMFDVTAAPNYREEILKFVESLLDQRLLRIID